jgi:hypothetical protein
MNNLLSYCGLVDARISASEKDLPVYVRQLLIILTNQYFLTSSPQQYDQMKVLQLQFGYKEAISERI